jgi:hypothetical protein
MCSLPHIRDVFRALACKGVNNETAQRKWQRILAEYVIARAEYQIAYQLFLSRPRPGGVGDAECAEYLAEQKARNHLLDVHDRMALLEADSWLDAPGALAD